MPQHNPYRPHAGAQPPLLVGRSRVTLALENQLSHVAATGTGCNPLLVWGVDGIGKTAVLRGVEAQARERGEFVVYADAAPGATLAQRIAQAFSLELRRAWPLPEAYELAIRVFRGFQLRADPEGLWSYNVAVEPARGYANSGDLKLDLPVLLRVFGEAARAEHTAILFVVDDLHQASERDLAAVHATLFELAKEQVPVSFLGAGLPLLPKALAAQPARLQVPYRSFALGFLNAEDATEAVDKPARKARVRWDEDALARAVSLAQGYPPFLQQYACSAWEQRRDPSAITLDDLRAGMPSAHDAIVRDWYWPRWVQAAEDERTVLRAMAADEGSSIVSAVAERTGKSPDQLAPARESLCRQGTIWEPEAGLMAFTTPGLNSYIKSIPTPRKRA